MEGRHSKRFLAGLHWIARSRSQRIAEAVKNQLQCDVDVGNMVPDALYFGDQFRRGSIAS